LHDVENCNYGREELLFLNMTRLGIIGELLHGEAAYVHELRGQMMEVERGTGSWRQILFQGQRRQSLSNPRIGPSCAIHEHRPHG
jgi:hypothetical protein